MFSRDMVVTNGISRALSQILKLTHEYAIFYEDFDIDGPFYILYLLYTLIHTFWEVSIKNYECDFFKSSSTLAIHFCDSVFVESMFWRTSRDLVSA